MAKGVANKEPELLVAEHDGEVMLCVKNVSGNTLYLDTQKLGGDDIQDAGYPLAPNEVLVLSRVKNQIWISADNNKSEFRFIKSYLTKNISYHQQR